MAYFIIGIVLVFAYPIVSFIVDVCRRTSKSTIEDQSQVDDSRIEELDLFEECPLEERLHASSYHDALRFDRAGGPQLYDEGGLVDQTDGY